MADVRTLEETIALLDATLESTHDGILVVDLNRRVILHNSRYLQMFRLDTDVLDRGIDGVLAAVAPQLEDSEAFIDKSHEIWAHPDREVFDVLQFKDGRVFERYIVPHRIGSRTIGLIGSFHDVSERWRTAQVLAQHRAFLEKAQEVAHIGSWVADLNETDRFGWSRETHRIFGVADGQFDGSPDAFFTFVHPDDRELVRAASAAARRDDALYDIEHRIVRADGTVRWVHAQADVIRNRQGRAVRMVGTIRDITERRLLEEQLRQSQKMEAIGRLAGGIAHDLNNALTAIAGYAELALGLFPHDHPAHADVMEIRRGAERAGSVTKQLLAFSRKQLLEPRVFSLNDTVAALGRLLSRLLGSDIQVHTRVGPSVPPILADPGQVEQAIINLAVNARDAMPSGGRLTLETSIADVDESFARTHVPMTPGRYAALRVVDTGHGMSADTQNRIFEPFFTTKEIGKGTGLGLSMVYGTLKQCGGYIFVDSEIGRGTTFTLYFPPAAMQSMSESPPAAARPAENRGHETILVVDDEVVVRNLVASALRNENYRVLLAGSADEALQIVASHAGTIDLLLTDAVMPGRSGIELARELTARIPGLPVILMTGYTQETLPVGKMGASVTLLEKPFTPIDLRNQIRAALDRSERMNESNRP